MLAEAGDDDGDDDDGDDDDDDNDDDDDDDDKTKLEHELCTTGSVQLEWLSLQDAIARSDPSTSAAAAAAASAGATPAPVVFASVPSAIDLCISFKNKLICFFLLPFFHFPQLFVVGFSSGACHGYCCCLLRCRLIVHRLCQHEESPYVFSSFPHR